MRVVINLVENTVHSQFHVDNLEQSKILLIMTRTKITDEILFEIRIRNWFSMLKIWPVSSVG